MPRLFRRETFIALRARKLGHQIASAIVNPTLKLPNFESEVRDPDETYLTAKRWERLTTRYAQLGREIVQARRLRRIIVLFIALVVVAAMILLYLLFSRGFRP